MEVNIHPRLQAAIEREVSAGRFPDASTYVNAALLAFEAEQEAEEPISPEHLDYLRRAVREGIDSLERGEGRPWDIEEMKAELRQRLVAKGLL